MNTMIQRFVRNPRQLLILDAAGAFITASFLFLIAENFSILIGISKTVLIFLSFTAVLIFGYSFMCSLVLKTVSSRMIRSLVVLNSLYCILSAGVVVYHSSVITIPGMLYLLAEIIIIIFLITIEYRVSGFLKREVE